MFKCRKLDIFYCGFIIFCGVLIFVDFIVKWINEMKVRNMIKIFIDRVVV